MPKQTWSVIVPCFNEAGTIKTLVERVVDILQQIAADYEILIVDDGSSDDSPKLIKELSAKYPKIGAIYRAKNEGLGAILREGYLSAKYENVISIPGDGQFDPAEIIPYAEFDEYTLISFYRKENTTYSFFRNELSFAHKSLNKILLGITLKDVNWAIIFKTRHFNDLDIQLHSTLIKTEICAKQLLLGYKVIEVPSIYHSRVYGQSKGASFKLIFQACSELVRLFFTVQKFKFNLRNRKALSKKQ